MERGIGRAIVNHRVMLFVDRFQLFVILGLHELVLHVHGTRSRSEQALTIYVHEAVQL